MNELLTNIRIGLALVLLGLIFGIGLGIGFGVDEDAFQEYIAQGIEANPDVHDLKSQDKIWRYAQRAHFHATGIAAFSIGLLLLTGASRLTGKWKKAVAVLIGLGGFYPLSWFSMFLLSPVVGREAAHAHIATEFFAYVGAGGLVMGLLILVPGLFLGWFSKSG